MLALARALLRNPHLLLLDEPTEGLSPLLVHHLRGILRELSRQGESLLLAEQNAAFALGVVQRVYLLEKGKLVDCVEAERLRREPELLRSWMG